jgi:hypothetical protein
MSERYIPGQNPTAPMRLCKGCNYMLPLDYFPLKMTSTSICVVCRDARKEAKPWTAQHIQRLRKAASRVLDLWPKYYDRWDDDDLQRLRELLAAADRDAGVTLAQLTGRGLREEVA